MSKKSNYLKKRKEICNVFCNELSKLLPGVNFLVLNKNYKVVFYYRKGFSIPKKFISFTHFGLNNFSGKECIMGHNNTGGLESFSNLVEFNGVNDSLNSFLNMISNLTIDNFEVFDKTKENLEDFDYINQFHNISSRYYADKMNTIRIRLTEIYVEKIKQVLGRKPIYKITKTLSQDILGPEFTEVFRIDIFIFNKAIVEFKHFGAIRFSQSESVPQISYDKDKGDHIGEVIQNIKFGDVCNNSQIKKLVIEYLESLYGLNNKTLINYKLP